ncbi:MAG TPA: PAAR domain-containing protein [Mycobacteriales bacterium]|nr:PAAR domain-containing protein [Mycobacteriales bacterium]
MPPAARIGDPTSHGGVISAPPPPAAAAVLTVLVEGKPAAVVGSVHTCVVPAHVPLGPANVIVPSPAAAAVGQVLIGGIPAARVGDRTACAATVLLGAPTVVIGGPG